MAEGVIGIGVVGYGYWGPNLVRNFASTVGAQVIAICDMDSSKLDRGKRLYPSVAITKSFRDLLTDSRIDAIAIATPVSTHYELALAALKAGKHVLVEKPLAQTSEEVRRLIEEAERRKLILMVDHTFLYTPAVKKIRDLIAEGSLGDIYYYNGIRASLGLFQSDVNVIWDLAVHDVSIIQYILNEAPVAVSATGASHVAGTPENMAHLTLFFQNSCIAHVVVSTKKWISLACRPGTHSCAISIAPLKPASPIATARGRSGYPAPNAMPTDRKIARCAWQADRRQFGSDRGRRQRWKLKTLQGPSTPGVGHRI
jgi:predicted dehydrogenase